MSPRPRRRPKTPLAWASLLALWMAVAPAQAADSPQGSATGSPEEDVDAQFEDAVARLYQAAQAGHLPARDKLIALAGQNVAAAQFRLGQLHYEPQAPSQLTRSLGEAMGWWHRASANGYGRASMALANLYDHGEGGLAVDAALALRLYELTLDQGWVNPTSQTRLARALLRNGQARDCARIASLLQAAAAKDFAEANQLLLSDTGYKSLCSPSAGGT